MSLLKRGLPLTVCAPDTTQLFDPGRHASHSRSPSRFLLCRAGRCWLRLLFDCCSGVSGGSGTESVGAPSSAALAGGRSRHELAGYKSAINSGESLALIFSRQYSMPYCWFSNLLMLSPTRTESPTVQGFGLY